MRPLPSRCVRFASALLMGAAASTTSAGALLDADATRVPAAFETRFAMLPQEDTRAVGFAADLRAPRFMLNVAADVVRLRDPRPDAENIGMLWATGSMGRRIAGNDRAWLHAEVVGSLFFAIFGDVGAGLPGIGGGVRGEWHLSRRFSLAASTKATVPFPIVDSAAAIRLTAGTLTLGAGWRDLRFLPVLLPGRYASGPQISASVTY